MSRDDFGRVGPAAQYAHLSPYRLDMPQHSDTWRKDDCAAVPLEGVYSCDHSFCVREEPCHLGAPELLVGVDGPDAYGRGWAHAAPFAGAEGKRHARTQDVHALSSL